MDNKNINENQIKDLLFDILLEETSKVSRQDYTRIQFKIEDFERKLDEAIREFRELADSIPDGLKTVSKGRLNAVSNCLHESRETIKMLKLKIRKHKKNSYTTQQVVPVQEKKKIK